MRIYELVLVIKTSVKEAELKKLLETVKGWLGDVTIKKEDDWGQRPLSYPIKKETAGHYVKFDFESETSVAKDAEQRIFRNDDILRHLLLRTK